jgi:hypothetical protein
MFIKVPDDEEHEEKVRRIIRIIHAIFLVIWIIILVYVCTKEPSFLSFFVGLIFTIPLALLVWHPGSRDDDCTVLHSGTLAISIIVTVTLINHLSENYSGNHDVMNLLVFGGLLSILLSVPNFYLGHEWLGVTHHLKTGFQILSVACIAVALTLYWNCRSTKYFGANKNKIV